MENILEVRKFRLINIEFYFTDLGVFAFKSDETNSKKFLKQCIIGISYPNENLNVKSENILRKHINEIE